MKSATVDRVNKIDIVHDWLVVVEAPVTISEVHAFIVMAVTSWCMCEQAGALLYSYYSNYRVDINISQASSNEMQIS